jgi:RNA polymerase sigma factor (sigma-70 family)
MLMDEYNVKVTVRNNLILKAIKDFGYTNLNNFAKATGIGVTGLYSLVNLMEPPIGVKGEFIKSAKDLMEVLGACPSELWTDEQLTLRLDSNRSERVMSKEALQVTLQSSARSLIGLDYPEQEMVEEDMARVMKDKLDSLAPRQRKVLQLRFGFDGSKAHTLEEVADIFEVTRETIRQIEARALRHMRHPTRSDDLKQFVDIDVTGK